MSILVKPGVRFVYAPAGFRILEALKVVSKAVGMSLTITSGSDGKHSGPTDPHYSGEAYDVRVHGLTDGEIQHILDILMHELGPRFYGFHESPGTSNAHIHVQRRNGTTYTINDYLAE
jgi:hypothetical protein